MTPYAYVSHASAGRLRIRIPSKRRNAPYFEEIEVALAEYPGVTKVTTQPLTASVLIIYDKSFDLAEVTALAEQAELFVLSPKKARFATITEVATLRLRTMDDQMRDLTGGLMDLRSLLFVMLLAMAIRQLLRGNIMAPALTLIAFALQVLNLEQTSAPHPTGSITRSDRRER
jgi:hypothetical protein